jgi:hypothetical protein
MALSGQTVHCILVGLRPLAWVHSFLFGLMYCSFRLTSGHILYCTVAVVLGEAELWGGWRDVT